MLWTCSSLDEHVGTRRWDLFEQRVIYSLLLRFEYNTIKWPAGECRSFYCIHYYVLLYVIFTIKLDINLLLVNISRQNVSLARYTCTGIYCVSGMKLEHIREIYRWHSCGRKPITSSTLFGCLNLGLQIRVLINALFFSN